ncbi:hypothetical protein M8C21_005540 [Ambrosia artemisiifolia]|uniref:cellulase n=1 Tax=Ambrosia artemisiifolia TaxID=4212 RepID=A0AAD5CQK2_AMBAR|nr:hypothetical protein M8C21_005540 [Ambrosia artemisiifolia]
MDFPKGLSLFHGFFMTFLLCSNAVHANQNYKDALAKSILYFQGQRSGRLPLSQSQNLRWRSASGLADGSQARVCI